MAGKAIHSATTAIHIAAKLQNDPDVGHMFAMRVIGINNASDLLRTLEVINDAAGSWYLIHRE